MNKINFAKILLWRGEGRGGWKRGEEEKKAGGWNETFIFTTVVTRAQDKYVTYKKEVLFIFNMLAHKLLITWATEYNYVTEF